VAFEGGVGFNLFDGNLTILATTHIGPELPDTFSERLLCACDPNNSLRFLNDIVTTWKVNDALTLINEANLIHDDGFKTTGYGMAQYFVYTATDWLKLVGRAEIWRDNGLAGAGFWVAGFPGNFDFVNAEYGFPNSSFVETPTTYFEVTGALDITPEIPKGTPIFQTVLIRPEIRYDRSLNGTTPFNGLNGIGGPGTPGFGVGTSGSQFTFGGDIVLKFGT
jgi:Putative beta-barrel porin-2, OmpL-like. bbp2